MPWKKADTEAAQLGILHYSDNLRTLRHLIQNLDSNLDLTAARGDQFNVENDVAGGPGVDLALPFFRDLLSDNPVAAAAGLGGSVAAQSRPRNVKKTLDDNAAMYTF
ncbi:hypothetical protein C8J56DRAFT_888923 [Mycena floridula]|nr:hypothetical protein C8J56DRAFT_888923 [Mycena floridula]